MKLSEHEQKYMDTLLNRLKSHPFGRDNTDDIIYKLGESNGFLGKIDTVIYNLEYRLDVPFIDKRAYIKNIKQLRNDYIAELVMPEKAKQRRMKRVVKMKGSR